MRVEAGATKPVEREEEDLLTSRVAAKGRSLQEAGALNSEARELQSADGAACKEVAQEVSDAMMADLFRASLQLEDRVSFQDRGVAIVKEYETGAVRCQKDPECNFAYWNVAASGDTATALDALINPPTPAVIPQDALTPAKLRVATKVFDISTAGKRRLGRLGHDTTGLPVTTWQYRAKGLMRKADTGPVTASEALNLLPLKAGDEMSVHGLYWEEGDRLVGTDLSQLPPAVKAQLESGAAVTVCPMVTRTKTRLTDYRNVGGVVVGDTSCTEVSAAHTAKRLAEIRHQTPE
ncbi:MAG: hypothetical protein S4CHLAM81_07940 [Chlamydiales bacterium]|nr:hypothetical protein [Chlamydiales bacterium]MCH9635576.1 hypothetical protein [Chlamydiales bacterium]MCH9703528.1 hypothetical protein [Chlamydiota bacterium]